MSKKENKERCWGFRGRNSKEREIEGTKGFGLGRFVRKEKEQRELGAGRERGGELFLKKY